MTVIVHPKAVTRRRGEKKKSARIDVLALFSSARPRLRVRRSFQGFAAFHALKVAGGVTYTGADDFQMSVMVRSRGSPPPT